MYFKYLIKTIALFLCAFILCACHEIKSNKPANRIQKDPPQVVVFFDKGADLIGEGTAQKAQQMLFEHGYAVQMQELTGRQSQYFTAIDDAVSKGAAGIVLALRYDLKADEAIGNAMKQDVKVLQLCGNYYASTVSFSINEYQVGYDTGRLVAEKLREKQDKPRITLITAKDLRNTESGFEDGLRELLPETVIRYKLIAGSDEQEMTPDFISTRYFSDAIVIFFCNNVKLPVFAQKPLVFYTGLAQHAMNADDKLILSQGDQLSEAVDQFINAVSGKRVDERGFYYESALN